MIHIEFVIIHPFREGNGRVARLLAMLMSLQSGNPPLVFNYIDKTKKEAGFSHYILAIHAGHAGNYNPMQLVFEKIIKDTLQIF